MLVSVFSKLLLLLLMLLLMRPPLMMMMSSARPAEFAAIINVARGSGQSGFQICNSLRRNPAK